MLDPDRFLGPTAEQKSLARVYYEEIADLPLVCPHGHVDAGLLSREEARFRDPVELFIKPDHYLLRMLYSQGVPLEELVGEQPSRQVWRRFSEKFYLFRATPTGFWLRHQLSDLFGCHQTLSESNADHVYDLIQEALESEAFRPRTLFERFRIEVLCTTDGAIDSLKEHQAIPFVASFSSRWELWLAITERV